MSRKIDLQGVDGTVPTMDTLRVATWNLLRAPDDDPARIEVATEVLRAVDADVICVQESWPAGLQRLATNLGMGIHASRDGSGCAVLTSLPVVASTEFALPYDYVARNAAVVTVRNSTGTRLWTCISTHLAWGGHTEGLRRDQAIALDLAAAAHEKEHPGSVTVLAGDFNSVPESSTVRFLSGLESGPEGSSLWLDAFAYRGIGDGSTVRPANPLAADTARSVGIVDPSMLPDRRIDYVMVRGWVYGKPGCPREVRVFGDELAPRYASDHLGVVADLWDPHTGN
jgi:endonuclease/exonuclease/phosphatase family metal-dependent hydrolase